MIKGVLDISPRSYTHDLIKEFMEADTEGKFAILRRLAKLDYRAEYFTDPIITKRLSYLREVGNKDPLVQLFADLLGLNAYLVDMCLDFSERILSKGKQCDEE